MAPLIRHWRLLIALPLACALAALGITYLLQPVYTARTTFLPPQQQQSSAAAAIASLGNLAGLTGAGAPVKSPADLFVALMQSSTVEDRIIERFKLMDLYAESLRSDARRRLENNTRVSIGKRDGLVTVEFDDHSPQRAAAVANAYVEELRHLTSSLAVSEAQQRRVFFEAEMKRAHAALTAAEQALQASDINTSTLKSDPRLAAEPLLRVRAQLAAAELRLRMLLGTMAEQSPEVQQQRAIVAGLQQQLAASERSGDRDRGSKYSGRFREFKYHEALFEVLSRQYESARLDEAKEGSIIQVVDLAVEPDRRSRPRRASTAINTLLVALLSLVVVLEARLIWSRIQPSLAAAAAT